MCSWFNALKLINFSVFQGNYSAKSVQVVHPSKLGRFSSQGSIKAIHTMAVRFSHVHTMGTLQNLPFTPQKGCSIPLLMLVVFHQELPNE